MSIFLTLFHPLITFIVRFLTKGILIWIQPVWVLILKLMKPKHLLIADDNKGVLESLKLVLEDDFEEITAVSNPNVIPGLLERKRFDVYLLDMNFSGSFPSGNEGLYWMGRIREADPDAVVVFITAYGDVNLAVKAVKMGAFDFILKPWDNQKLRITLQAAAAFGKSKQDLRKAAGKEVQLKMALSEQFPLVKGKSATMQKIYEIMEKVAPTDADILILGENGTGKEVIAREIHRLSQRRDEIFLTADIASLSEGLIESELFGHKKDRSLMPTRTVPANSSRPPVEPCSWMRSATCRCQTRPSCFRCFRPVRSLPWDPTGRFRWIYA